MHRIALALTAALIAGCSTNPAPEARAVAPAVATAAMESPDVAALQHITRVLIDASSLYAAAAEDSENAAHASQLRTLATARRGMADRFQARVATLGAAPAENGQALGTAHRVFMEARTLGNEDTKVAVEEALRGENYLVEQLNEAAADADLRADTRAFLTSQLPSIRADRDRLDAYAHTLG